MAKRNMPAFRICIFSSAWTPVRQLQHLIQHLSIDLTEVEVAGILYDTALPRLTWKKKVERVRKYLLDPDFTRYFANNISERVGEELGKILTRVLHLAHGTARSPNRAPATMEEFVVECKELGIALKITNDVHDEESLEFVAGLKADLGITFGSRIIKPKLFSIPRLGCINSHQHKLPDYRGSGAPGLWELCDGKNDLTVAVHRVTTAVNGRPVLDERSFPIEPYDSLTSVALKANLVGVDDLIDVTRAECYETTVETPQSAEGTVFKGIPPHRMLAMEESVGRKRKPFRPSDTPPFHKLFLRLLTNPVLIFRSHRRTGEKNFPVIILSHDVISDRPKHQGLSTDHFLRHVHFLKEHYRVVSMADAMETLKRGEVDAPTVVLTFDDGYAENFLSLRAVTEPENTPFIFFVCTQNVAELSEFQLNVEGGEHGFLAMSWDAIRYFARHGVYIGSHARAHFDCGSTNESRQLDEISGSLEDFRRELGHDVPYFLFPKGCPENISDPARHIALQRYPYVFSTCCGVNKNSPPPGAIIGRCKHPQSL